MGSYVALGVPIRWAHQGPADFTPLLAILVAVLVARFVIRAQITVMTFMLAATVGAGWAWAITRWGIELPTLAVILPTITLSIRQARSG